MARARAASERSTFAAGCGFDVEVADVPARPWRLTLPDGARTDRVPRHAASREQERSSSAAPRASARPPRGALAERGAQVTIADLERRQGQGARRRARRRRFAGATSRAPTQVEAAVGAAAQADGGLRISMHCAGIGWARAPRQLARRRTTLQPSRRVVARQPDRHVQRAAPGGDGDARQRAGRRAASAACASTPRRSPPSTGRSARSPTRPRRAGSSGMTLPAARDLVAQRHPRLHDRPGPVRHAAARPRCPRRRARRSARRCRSRSDSAGRPSTPRWRCHIVENPMLNGETIRLDGALRMAPK